MSESTYHYFVRNYLVFFVFAGIRYHIGQLLFSVCYRRWFIKGQSRIQVEKLLGFEFYKKSGDCEGLEYVRNFPCEFLDADLTSLKNHLFQLAIEGEKFHPAQVLDLFPYRDMFSFFMFELVPHPGHPEQLEI